MRQLRFGSWVGLRTVACILLLFAVGTYGCSSDGDDDGNGGSGGPGAFNFTEENMSTAAGIAIGALEILPNFSEIILKLLEYIFGSVAVQPAVFQPADVIPGICQNLDGVADLDYNLIALTATLTFSDCDLTGDGTLIDGTVTLAFTGIPDLGPPLAADANVTMNVTTTDDVGSQNLSGNFGLAIDSADLVNYTAEFTAADPDGYLRVSEGSQSIRYGCFDILLSFSVLPDFGLEDGYFQLTPIVVVINASGKVFSITSAGLGVLDFEPYPEGDFSYPDAGGMRFFSFVLSEEEGCAAVGSPNGVGNSDGSNFILRAVPGDLDDVELELRDAGDTILYTEDTTWSALTD